MYKFITLIYNTLSVCKRLLSFFILHSINILIFPLMNYGLEEFVKAILVNIPTAKIGKPIPYLRTIDGISVLAAAFNNELQTTVVTPYTISGKFGIPSVLSMPISSNFPIAGSNWIATSFIDNLDGTATWTGTAVTPNDVVITANSATFTFAGLVAGNPITGTFNIGGTGFWNILTGNFSVSVTSVTGIFCGVATYMVYAASSQIIVFCKNDGVTEAIVIKTPTTGIETPVLVHDITQPIMVTRLQLTEAMAAANTITFAGWIIPITF